MSLIYKIVFGLFAGLWVFGAPASAGAAADAAGSVIFVQADEFEMRPPDGDDESIVPDPEPGADEPSEDGTARGPSEETSPDEPWSETPGCPLRDGPLELLV